MKNIASFILCTLGFGIAQAGTMGPVCSPDNVTVPCPCNAWDVGISALYLQPNTNSALLNPILNPISNDSHTVDSSWDWGFLLEGSYHFNTGNDLNVNWLHFNPDNSDYFSFFSGDEFNPVTTFTDLKFDTKFDAVNLEFAQTSHFGKKKTIRFYAGGQYVNTRITRSDNQFEKLPSDPTPHIIQRSVAYTKFQGAGPRVGVDMSRDMKYGFALFAQSAMTLLTGQGKASLSGANLSGIAFPFSAQAKQTRLVPELEAKLGASYQLAVGNGQISLMGGWMWQHYLHMFLLPPGGNSNPATTVTQHDFSLDGPFIKGKWVSGC
ncbi:Lpg1974 family pore-forming outer membrane protein [Legionella sp. WA2024007413]